MGMQSQALRALLAKGDAFIAADCYSALTARIVQHVGFPAAYVGGHSIGVMHYAIPDCGLLTPTEMIGQAARIVEAIDIPLIADGDSLGESVADAFRTTRRYEQIGVAAVHVEDELNPKHSTFSGGLLPIADMQARVDAAVRARRDPSLMVIARTNELYTDELGGGGEGSLDDAIARCIAYEAAGADAVIVALCSPEHVPLLVRELTDRKSVV